jgi:hypothetical protein
MSCFTFRTTNNNSHIFISNFCGGLSSLKKVSGDRQAMRRSVCLNMLATFLIKDYLLQESPILGAVVREDK